MRKNSPYLLLLSLIFILALSACEFPLSVVEVNENILPEIEKQSDSLQARETNPTTIPEPTNDEIALEMDVEPTPEPTEEPTAEPTKESTEAASSINPLTGMPVENPDYLEWISKEVE